MSNILTTRNITLVSYQLDEVQSSDDKQAEILSNIIMKLGVAPKLAPYNSYDAINKALDEGSLIVGQFVLFIDPLKIVTVVVAKYRNIN